MNDFEKKALEYIAKLDSIVQNKSQESVDSLFDVLDCLSLPVDYHLGLKLAQNGGHGDTSWFYTYQGEDPNFTFGSRPREGHDPFKVIIVEPTAMGAWQLYLMIIAESILPTTWHGGYSAREYFFDRDNYNGIKSAFAKDVNICISQIPEPKVEMEDGMAIVSCPYWSDRKGLVLQSIKVIFQSDGTVYLRPNFGGVLYRYNCGVLF